MIALIGSGGSMGKRYQAILNHLKEPFLALDAADLTQDEIIKKASKCDRILLASPTPTHLEYLKALLPSKAKILCEKPVCTDLDQLIALHAECDKKHHSYNMVMQYKRLDVPLKTPNRWSYYNYFRHGNDGLAWDCLQTIALAQGPVWLKEDSPVWECTINGRRLSIAEMDQAYIAEIRLWLMDALDQSMDEILQAHKKVVIWKAENENN